VIPYYKSFNSLSAADVRETTTDISPGVIEISSSVNVSYEFA